MLCLTSKIHKELIGEKNQIVSALILSTTFLWINFFHMATQDILFSAIVTFGIFSTIDGPILTKCFCNIFVICKCLCFFQKILPRQQKTSYFL